MLEEKDLQAIAKMMAQQRQEIMQDATALIAQQRKDIMHDVLILMENEFKPKFDLLAEGQKTILETLAPKSRVEALEDEVTFMKSVIKALSQEVAELKKAQ